MLSTGCCHNAQFDDSSLRKAFKYLQIIYIASRQQLESVTYIFAADSMGLSSVKFLWWAPTDAPFLQQNEYQPFVVIQTQ